VIDKLRFHYVQQQMLGKPEQSSRFGHSFIEKPGLCSSKNYGAWAHGDI
jgi:hypothetical protein